MMKLIFSILVILVLTSSAYSQSGRRPKEIKVPDPPPEEVNKTKPKPESQDQASPVTAERNEDYRCTEDGTLARLLDTDVVDEKAVLHKRPDAQAIIISKPPPSYTKEARRNSVQGFVKLRVLLAADGKISRVRVLRGLPAGLTESAIKSACKIKFKPALKDGRPVARWIVAEYVFRISDSSIFFP
jgi:TonB family protein